MKKLAVIFLSLCLAVMAFAGGKADSAAGSGDIIIGGIFPLSGGVAVYGTEAQKGIQLAIEEINAAGGVGGRNIVLISEDDEGDAAKSVSAFRKLTTQNKAKLIIGSLTSGCTIAVSSLAQAQGVLLMAPAASAEAVTDAGDYVFRACFIDPFQGTVAGVFAFQEINAKRAAVLYDNGNDYSVGLQENFVKAFTSRGGTVVASEVYNGGDVDFNAQLTRIKAANPDMVYLPDYYSTVALIAKQLRAQGINAQGTPVPIMGADGWDGLQENAGDEVLNGFFTNNFTPDSTVPKVASFVKAFQGKFGALPTSFAALGYDSLYLVRDAIISAGSTEPAAVRDALAKIDGNYVTGNIRFDAKRNPVKSAVVLELVKGSNGKLTTAYKSTVNP
ncbi:ABC transporter substrate-binding protein [Treponema primitia]|uniref:ABC transporter substrate-binding protein n=1 Tax=Treponema primitia TaxID=88058 RepID=UPI0002555838|nr:ABC transporter substrate-binding protein [Treponema primitia]